MMFPIQTKMFQSTYLYKVRLTKRFITIFIFRFQSTYLYKVRQQATATAPEKVGFNPRTYIRYDLTVDDNVITFNSGFQSTYLYKVRPCWSLNTAASRCFNPRTYIRYDRCRHGWKFEKYCFNPRTYIRYDSGTIWYETEFKLFQSTYLYKVRPSGRCLAVRPERVSIHVPI